MPIEKILPSILIAISAGAALVYLVQGDWKHVTYWTAAAVLNYSVTWL